MDPVTMITVGSMVAGIAGNIFGSDKEQEALEAAQRRQAKLDRNFQKLSNKLLERSTRQLNRFYDDQEKITTNLFKKQSKIVDDVNAGYRAIFEAQEEAAERSLNTEQLKLQQTRLDASRLRRQSIRESIIASSIGLSNAANQGAQYGSGARAGQQQSVSERTLNLAAVNQNLQIAEKVFTEKQAETAALTDVNRQGARISTLNNRLQLMEKKANIELEQSKAKYQTRKMVTDQRMQQTQLTHQGKSAQVAAKKESGVMEGRAISKLGDTLFSNAPTIGKVGASLF